jgi:HAD superfamily hydrolase (TIGR01484 family)
MLAGREKVCSFTAVRTLDACPHPELLLSFDFDGTLHNPAENPPVPREFFEIIRELRERRGAVWGINTGRSIPQVLEGLLESHFPFLPDWVIAREREIYFPNPFGRFLPHNAWNLVYEEEIRKLFKKSRKTLRIVRAEIEEHTGAQWIEMKGEPAGIISRTEEEMEWLVAHITPLVAPIRNLGWQRNSIYLRFGHTKYQKGSSMSEVARLYQLDSARTFAMGDSHNDLEMLSEEHAAYAACPSNAVDAIRQLVVSRHALVTTQGHGHGVVEALTSYFSS